LQDKWCETSSVNAAYFVKKICYSSRDIEIFLKDNLARPGRMWLCTASGHAIKEKDTADYKCCYWWRTFQCRPT